MHNESFFRRPHWTRRHFFQIAGAGVTASFLNRRYARAAEVTSAGAVTKNTAKNVIFILMAGAPSQIDTFDLKMLPGTTPSSFAPSTINGVAFPTGLMPNLAGLLPEMAIVRSMQSWALVHSQVQTWVQIGRNPFAALGNIAPNIGSVVAIEKDKERLPSQIFPAFVALNSGGGVTQGYFPAVYAPFKVVPGTAGVANTTNPEGQSRLDRRWSLLHSLDVPLRLDSPYGKPLEDYDNFYSAAKGLTYSPVVNQAFGFTAQDSARYGSSATGNACLVAYQVLKANQGTRYIQITSADGWDMHQNIYAAASLPAKAKLFDTAVGTLLKDLKSSGLLSETLVVMMGEFGRTIGPLTAAQGRDHYPLQFVVFAGGGIQGGRALGATSADGSIVTDYGWSQNRYIRPEDIEATIYSAVGIDWTTIRRDDPFGRGFEYVPFASDGLYAPVNELWG